MSFVSKFPVFCKNVAFEVSPPLPCHVKGNRMDLTPPTVTKYPSQHKSSKSSSNVSPQIEVPWLPERVSSSGHTMIRLQKAQRTQDIECYVTHSTPSLQQVLKSWSNFILVLFGKGREIQRATLTNPCINFDKFV